MKSLFVLDNTQQNFGVKNAQLIACDTLNQIVYFATATTVSGHNVSSGETSSFLSLIDDDYLDDGGNDRILTLHYLFDQDSVCITTTKGDLLLWQPEMRNLECVGSVDAGFTCAQWSPDQELFILTTCNSTLVVMTKNFDPLYEFPIHTKDFGEAEFVNVGWGQKETQFHGSEGKEAAQKKKMSTIATVLAWDDRRTEISWRGDGQLFAISSIDENTNSRHIRVFDRDGKLQATNEVIDGLENCLSWKPSGNLIACPQRKPNRHDIIFLEKNGLQHGEFTLPIPKDEKKICQLSWNSNSDVLAIVLEDMKDDARKTVQLWTVNNYHWYLQQEMNFNEKDNRFAALLWDPESGNVLHLVSSDGMYSKLVLHHRVNQSRGKDNLSMVGVVDGSNILLTPFKLQVVPPPMSTHSVALDAPVLMFSFGVGDKQHDLVAFLSTKTFTFLNYLPEGKYETKNALFDESFPAGNVRHLTWFRPDMIAVVVDGDTCNSIYFLKIITSESGMKLVLHCKLPVVHHILILFSSEDVEAKLFVQDAEGNVYDVEGDADGFSLSDSRCALPQPCSYVCAKNIEGKDIVFGLTNHFRLFMNETEIANNCTSMLLHDDFLLLTTHDHTLRSVYITSLQNQTIDSLDASKCYDESVRRVERGSKLVTAVQNGTLVVLQMPRGNLESIHPRALTITYLQSLLSNLDYGTATTLMLKHRINLNLIYDHNSDLFLSSVEKFIRGVSSVNHINLFLADLMEEDTCCTLYQPYYKNRSVGNAVAGQSSETKVDLICKAVREGISRNPSDKLILPLLTTYAKQSEPDLETVLLKIKELKDRDHVPEGKDAVTYEQALKYILYLVDVDRLYDIALGLYDFSIVLMVAEKSQKDPKEYLPILNNFKKMEENYRKYSIDKYLKKFAKALGHLVKCEDRFEECKELVKEHKLYKQALKMFPHTSTQYKEISSLYGDYLRTQKLPQDAAIIYSRSGHHEKALVCLRNTTNWEMSLSEAKLLNYTTDDTMKLCRELSMNLRAEHMYREAAFLLDTYVKDIEESVVCLIEGGLWFHAQQLAQQHDRDDLLETNLKPSMLEQYEQLEEKIHELSTKFVKHKERLKVVVEKKAQEALEILEGVRDDPENDLFSDTSSITGQSVSTLASTESKRSTMSGHSRKSRNKVGRKKYKLREGSKHEDFALKEALSEIVTSADKLKEDVSGLLKILVFYFEEEKASKLQTIFVDLLDMIEKNMKEIWKPENSASQPDGTVYGPHATVQSILDQRLNAPQKTDNGADEPKSVEPTIRPNIHWKIHLLRP